MSAQRFLFVTTKYPTADGDTYLISELADALVAAGHTVDVLHLAWDAPLGGRPAERVTAGGVRVVDVPPSARGARGSTLFKASKFVLTDRRASRELHRRFDLSTYNALVAFTPALTAAGPIRAARAAGIKVRVLFVFDFFPVHHREIGLIPPGVIYRAALWLEERLIRSFTTIVCNLPSNRDYLRRHFRLRPSQRVTWTPLWTRTDPLPPADRSAIRAEFGLPLDRPIAIFGGQITEGRGIEQMLAAAQHARDAGSPLLFLFVGNGRLVAEVQRRAAALGNVRHLAGVPRDRYLPLVAACDVGMVATVEGVSSFSFPTKTLDYLRAGLPTVAAVEPGSDYAAILEEDALGRWVAFGDAAGYFQALAASSAPDFDRAAMRARAAAALDRRFDVRHAVATVLAAFSPQEEQP